MIDELIDIVEEKVKAKDKENFQKLDKDEVIEKYIELKFKYIELCACLDSIKKIVDINNELLNFDEIFNFTETAKSNEETEEE